VSPIEDLIARREIAELKARYCRLLDTKQWDAWRALFTDDVEIDISDDITPEMGTPTFRGRDRLVEQTRRFMDPGQSAHHVHSSEIAFDDDDHARGIWAMSDHVVFPPGGPVPFKAMTARGFYHERYVRTADGWKIAANRLERISRTLEPLD
jgi:hypothetical protein